MDELKITTSPTGDILVTICDAEIADAFDDFLVDSVSSEVFFKFDDNRVEFCFGTSLTVSQIEELCARFSRSLT